MAVSAWVLLMPAPLTTTSMRSDLFMSPPVERVVGLDLKRREDDFIRLAVRKGQVERHTTASSLPSVVG